MPSRLFLLFGAQGDRAADFGHCGPCICVPGQEVIDDLTGDLDHGTT